MRREEVRWYRGVWRPEKIEQDKEAYRAERCSEHGHGSVKVAVPMRS